MFNTIREFFAPLIPINSSVQTNLAFITSDGALISPTGEIVQKYSRRRDAIRGAKRRGWDIN